MSYLGRRGASAALTSADIPNDSITAAKIVDGAVTSDLVYLENATTTQNLSGTYSTERMYLNDSYTLTGDVTITGHLALGTVADADVVITQDSTERTITGSGTLESGELLSSKQTDLTGMTGELGSVVTGSPNLNLSNTISAIKVHMGVHFFDQGDASGTVSITGVGFEGNYLEAWVNFAGAINYSLRSYGYAKKVGSTITQQCIQFSQNSSTAVLNTHFASTSDSTSTQDGAYQSFAITSFDFDGFTFANTKTSTPSGSHGLTYIVKYYGEMA